MRDELLGLFHDSTMTSLYKIYKRNYINLMSFVTQKKVTLSDTAQLSLATWWCPSDRSVCPRHKPQSHARCLTPIHHYVQHVSCTTPHWHFITSDTAFKLQYAEL